MTVPIHAVTRVIVEAGLDPYRVHSYEATRNAITFRMLSVDPLGGYSYSRDGKVSTYTVTVPTA